MGGCVETYRLQPVAVACVVCVASVTEPVGKLRITLCEAGGPAPRHRLWTDAFQGRDGVALLRSTNNHEEPNL